jgi:hypothetical protein
MLRKRSGRSSPNRQRRLLLRRVWETIALAAAAGAVPAAAQVLVDESAAALERSVKAAFVFKFAGFVEWPAQALPPEAAIRIGVMGEETIVREINEAASSRTVEGRRVLAKRIEPGDSLEGVHILFMREPAFRRLADEVADLKPEAMLIVTESPGALERGSIVNFAVDDGRVRFDLSLEAAERRGLKLSSRLITVARRVVGGPK